MLFTHLLHKSIGHDANLPEQSKALIAYEWQQGHEACSLDRVGHCVLTDRGAACLTTANNFSVTVDQLLQQFNVFVIDVHWARTLTINVQRVLRDGACVGFGLSPRHLSSHLGQDRTL